MPWRRTGNQQLRQLDALQREHERQRGLDQDLLGAEARGRILALATEFQPVWQDPATAPIERKRIVALLIEDVTLAKTDHVFIHGRFRGGQTQSLTIDKAPAHRLDPQDSARGRTGRTLGGLRQDTLPMGA